METNPTEFTRKRERFWKKRKVTGSARFVFIHLVTLNEKAIGNSRITQTSLSPNF